MREHYTIIYFLLAFGSIFLGGTVLTPASAQTNCGINVSFFNVLPSETTIDGVLYKKVQVVVNNPNPGLFKRFYFLFDNAERNDSTKTYAYGLNTDEFLVPVDVEKITFFDVNSSNCNVEYTPNFTPNICTFNVTPYIGLSESCYERTANIIVNDSITIDSVAWIRNGGSVPVHDELSWGIIPPGDYKVFIYDDKGCEATTEITTCITRTEAGEDFTRQYCLGEDDTVNLYDHLSAGVDPGGFYSESFSPLDSLDATLLTFDAEGTLTYFYIAPAENEIPDTSQFTIEVRDCSVCAYELISAARHCARPNLVEVTIGGGNPEDTIFRVTLPDGSIVPQVFYKPFRVDFPAFQDSFDLVLQMDTPTGTCDTVLNIGPIGNPEIQFQATEIIIPGDSVGIEVTAFQGVPPYDLDIFVGSQQQFVRLGAGESRELVFLQSVDTAILMAMDTEGCVGIDTLLLTPDCLRPEVTTGQGVCGVEKGWIAMDSSMLPAGSQITWMDTSGTNLWHREGLIPGRYSYTVTYDHCTVKGAVMIEDAMQDFPQVFNYDNCPIDGRTQIYIRDSAQVSEWSLGESVLPFFTGYFSDNQDLVFRVETHDGCIDTFHFQIDEEHWLEEIGMRNDQELTATLEVDISTLDAFGWTFSDSLLCNNCENFRADGILPAGNYVFYAEQFPGCRRDTVLQVVEPELTFLMPNAITPGSTRNNRLQIFDPMGQMASILEFQVYDRFGNVLFQKFDFMPDDDASIHWPAELMERLPSVIICVARIQCREGEEVTVAQDVLILR